MTSGRRMGVKGSETWSLLLDAAERIMRTKGYAAVTSRGLGREAGLSPQIVYFYFRTMDDLFEALFKRLADSVMASVEAAATDENPILAIWTASCDPTRSALMVEFIGLSNHRKGLQRQIGEFGQRYNQRQAQIIEQQLSRQGVDLARFPPAMIASILENLAKGFVFGEGYDIASHDQAKQFVTTYLTTHFAKP